MERIVAHRVNKPTNNMKMLSRMIQQIAENAISGCGHANFWPDGD